MPCFFNLFIGSLLETSHAPDRRLFQCPAQVNGQVPATLRISGRGASCSERMNNTSGYPNYSQGFIICVHLYRQYAPRITPIANAESVVAGRGI
jgi:hypothetical protein